MFPTALIVVFCSAVARTLNAQVVQTTPAAVAEELLAVDRAFSYASSKTNVIDGLAAMFDSTVIMPIPGGNFTEGIAQAVAALRSNPDNEKSLAEWAPIRAGVSADGTHGFTFGFITVHKSDGSKLPGKYLAYWIKGENGWRIVAYRRRPRPAGEVSVTLMPPALPKEILAVGPSNHLMTEFRASLAAAERAFSADAQIVGLREAFGRYGSSDAVNMGGPDDAGFVVGAAAIAQAVAAGATGPSSLSWAPDRVIVAPSGDLGITFGFIRHNRANADGTTNPPIPFFTIWRRPDMSMPWRYIAE